MSELVKAQYVSPMVGALPNGQVVGPGDTAEIPAGEAAASDSWQAPASAAPPASSRAQSAPAEPSTAEDGDA